MYMLMFKKDDLDTIVSSNGIESKRETWYLYYLNFVTTQALTVNFFGLKF